MQRKTAVAVLAACLTLLFAAACPEAEAGMFRRRQSDEEIQRTGKLGGRTGVFPETGAMETLIRVSDVLTYKSKQFQDLYGTAGNRYIQYGLITMMSCNYTYGVSQGPLSIEIANMPTPTAAAGLFHHHRGSVLKNLGRPIDVGAEGVLDVRRSNRNLYFYRGNQFVKIVYSGDPPVPPLVQIADAIDGKMPKGRDARPDGFEYIDIEGVNQDTVSLTPGFAFGYNFLPPAVTASAPGGGSAASDLYIITKPVDREATEVFKGYSTYLRLNAEYFEPYKRGKVDFIKAVDPNQGRVVIAVYRNCLIIAARPDGYDKGEALIDLVMEKIDERRGSGGGSSRDQGDQPQRKRWNPFRRRAG